MSDTDRLRELVQGCVLRGEVTLTSGKKSDFYVDGRLVTLSAEGSHLVGKAVLALARELNATAVAGPTVAACPLVSAAGVLAHQDGYPLKLAYVRSTAKGHGTKKAIEGPPLTSDDRVLIVDDLMTSGGSLVQSIERVREETGAKVLGAFCIVDRQEGGAARLTEADVPLHALLTRQDLDPGFVPKG